MATGNDFPEDNDFLNQRWVMHTMRALVVSAVLAATLVLAGGSAALAGEVDPSTLQPPPPPGARCHQAGNQVICDTVLNFTLENAPDFEAPCGVVYLTGTDFRDGFRIYQDGKIVRRHVTGELDVTANLSPTGDGPTVRLIAHWGWWAVWPTPGRR
jgi:hypothetical protein